MSSVSYEYAWRTRILHLSRKSRDEQRKLRIRSANMALGCQTLRRRIEVVITRRTRNAFAPFGHAGSNPAVSATNAWLERTQKQHLNKLMYIKEKNMHQLIFMLTL